jgi:hypothetical protein
MANEKRMRIAVLESGGSQRIRNRSVILSHLTGHRARSLLRQDAQAKAHQRQWGSRFVGMHHKPELVRLGSAPEAQSNPTPKSYSAVVDVRDTGRF